MPRPASVRVVPELRAVHVDRHRRGTPADLLYFTPKYDLAGTTLRPGIEQVGLVSALWRLATGGATVLEVPEPLWLRFWPRHVALVTAFRLGGLLLRRRREVCTYAMENNALDVLVRGRGRAPRFVVPAAATVVGAVARLSLDRIAYASPAARDAYGHLPFVGTIPSTVSLELPEPTADPRRAEPLRAVFLGVLEHRKGLRELMRAWPAVEQALPGACLDVVGSGPLTDELRDWAASAPSSRRLLGHLTHAAAQSAVATASVLVAPSVPDGRWVEQIGLPIKEGLAAGATIVTTRQTGLAAWLGEHGHHVVDIDDPAALPTRLSRALVSALEHPLPRDEVRSSLPERDGRLSADAWLHADARSDALPGGDPRTGTGRALAGSR
jgi:glycosyltransferase involved in cell wall biosynthesis